MANIHISLQEVQDTANQLRSLNMLMDEELNAMKSEMNRLDSSWISDGSLEIRNKFNLFSTRFEKQKETINHILLDCLMMFALCLLLQSMKKQPLLKLLKMLL